MAFDPKMLGGILLQVLVPIAVEKIDDLVEKAPDAVVKAFDAFLALFDGASDAIEDPALASLLAIAQALRDEDRDPTPAEQAELDAYLEAQRRKAFGGAAG